MDATEAFKKGGQTMTRPEITGKRDLAFNEWIKKYLPDSYGGYLVTDVDFVLYDESINRFMILEVKTKNGVMKYWQKRVYKQLAKWIEIGIRHDEYAGPWQFLGFHQLIFQHTTPEDGRMFFDNKEVERDELLRILEMKDTPEQPKPVKTEQEQVEEDTYISYQEDHDLTDSIFDRKRN